MARVVATLTLNLIDPVSWSGQLVAFSSNQIALSDGIRTGVYDGVGFQIAGNQIVSGTVTAYTEYLGSDVIGQFSGLSFPLARAEAYFAQNNLTGLFSEILSGSDDIYGGAFNDRLAGYGGNDFMYGGSGNDFILGGAGNDTLQGGSGFNYLDGGAGLDFAYYNLKGSDLVYTFPGDGTIVVGDRSGLAEDTLVNVERLEYTDGYLAFDIDGVAGQAYRVYQAAFDRTPDIAGLGYWIKQMDAGVVDLRSVASGFMNSQEFQSLYGPAQSLSNDQFLTVLYENVLGRDFDQGGYDYWLGQMDSGAQSRVDVFASFSESNENKANVYDAIDQGIWYI